LASAVPVAAASIKLMTPALAAILNATDLDFGALGLKGFLLISLISVMGIFLVSVTANAASPPRVPLPPQL
jgi:hypothetical protein